MSLDSSLTAWSEVPLAYPQALSEPEKLLAAYFKSSAVGLGILDAELRYLAVKCFLK
jgi:hypothetical protein